MNDPIVDEVRRIRDEHAARFNYDLHAIFLDIKKRERERGLNFVEGIARQPPLNRTPQQAKTVLPDSRDTPQLPAGSVGAL